MRATRPFDPGDYHYGPATASVRAILEAWMDIDWFVPAASPDAGAERFAVHQTRAHAAAPELVAATVALRTASGAWPEFVAWCDRVRAIRGYDWKFGLLKTLGLAHSRSCNWTAEAFAGTRPWPPRPGDLVVLLPHDPPFAMWQGVYPTLAPLGTLDEVTRLAASFYLSFAHGDLLDAIQWQLAEGHDDTSGNPFVPLIECYARGGYPFSLGARTAVLFGFSARDVG